MTQPNTRAEQEQTKTGTHILAFPDQRSNTASTPIDPTDATPTLGGAVPPTIEQPNMELLTALIQQVVRTTIDEIRATDNADDDEDWSLDVDQMFFMLQYNNVIETAFEVGDMEILRELAASDEYLSVFGDMGFDEAYDRYETMLEEGRA